tara:strand:+ start:3087 stop:3293 length:207 start_codon:yes stop_codon:yes gene_type:complete
MTDLSHEWTAPLWPTSDISMQVKNIVRTNEKMRCATGTVRKSKTVKKEVSILPNKVRITLECTNKHDL